MTDINQLAKLSIRTESLVDNLNNQRANLREVLELVAIAGGILDQVKRKIYYGERGQFNVEKLDDLAYRLANVESDRFGPIEMEAHRNEGSAVNTRVVHGIVGVITEAAEMAEALIKYLDTGAFDAVNLIEEKADVDWYQAVLADELQFPLEASYEFLLAKLAARYGDKFSDVDAIIRDLGTERDVMERFLKAQNESL